jgi:hypothetical protein
MKRMNKYNTAKENPNGKRSKDLTSNSKPMPLCGGGFERGNIKNWKTP